MNQKIDFVITYVNGNDASWIKKKSDYLVNDGNQVNHFRDWDNLKYFFRGVEKYASFVNKIYFITDHQVPSWLDTNNPKLVIVNHEDYLDTNDLPVFNSNAIELKIHKIKDLCEQFVYFNDDVFIINKLEETDLFKNNLPCDSYGEGLFIPNYNLDSFPHFLLNDIEIINKYFNKKECYNKNIMKYFNFKYLKQSLKTLYFLPFKHISSINNPHIATSYLKSTFNEVWEKENSALTKTCQTKFRDRENINIYLFRYYQLLSGKFSPRTVNFGHYYGISNNNTKLINDIKNHKYKMICINDDNINIDFEEVKCEINNTLNEILPNKSTFER